MSLHVIWHATFTTKSQKTLTHKYRLHKISNYYFIAKERHPSSHLHGVCKCQHKRGNKDGAYSQSMENKSNASYPKNSKIIFKNPFEISVYCLKVVGFQEFSSSRENNNFLRIKIEHWSWTHNKKCNKIRYCPYKCNVFWFPNTITYASDSWSCDRIN